MGRVSAALGRVYVKSGRMTEAKRILHQLTTSREYVSAYAVASLHAALGSRDQAFAWLEKAYEEKAGSIQYIKTAPEMDSLRTDPRYTDLLKRMGLPQ